MGQRWARDGVEGGVTVIVIHTWRDEHRLFKGLVAELGDADVFHILPPDPEREVPPRRTAAWVDRCEAVLAGVPVSPPYRVIGWSFGGVVGLELARRWRAAGRDVRFVGLIDSTRPRPPTSSDRDYIWYHLGVAAALRDPSARYAYLGKKALRLAHRRHPRLGRMAVRAATRWGVLERQEAEFSEKPEDPLVKSIHTSFLNYDAAPVPFPISLYATESSIEKSADPLLRWGAYLHGGYEIVQIPGNHFSLFGGPHVGRVADALRRSIRRADRDSEAGP